MGLELPYSTFNFGSFCVHIAQCIMGYYVNYTNRAPIEFSSTNLKLNWKVWQSLFRPRDKLYCFTYTPNDHFQSLSKAIWLRGLYYCKYIINCVSQIISIGKIIITKEIWRVSNYDPRSYCFRSKLFTASFLHNFPFAWAFMNRTSITMSWRWLLPPK